MAYLEISATFPPEAAELLRWFEDYYVLGKTKERLGIRLRSPPLFSPDLWSVEELVRNKLPRGTNGAEAWHRRLGVLMRIAHPPLYQFLSVLRGEQQETKALMELVRGGGKLPAARQATVEREKKIRAVFERRGELPVREYLEVMSNALL
ncbi:hypothetical protein IscW_ISCW011516 [Ixodes scapularis]|uniref:Uncharacterized protein n=1 Tax=Ixodes scapularis TaxID=6945 RepID=B7Q6T7_IXOSC|nr:hypothetical protein IscW_ISCW011516 [Ixodes scapularis]|eukprot:XP_002412034.1 hypothetical protein IscW_ISCW011516 [Ixodes scapularis]